MGDTTPQDRAVEVAVQALARMGASAAWREADARAVVKDLADAGLLSSGTQEDQGDGSLRSTPSAAGPDLVDAVAEVLRDFKFEVGPITLEMLKVGQAVYLTPEERHQIAHAALNAVGQVKAGE
jgi:hypothetical protein